MVKRLLVAFAISVGTLNIAYGGWTHDLMVPHYPLLPIGEISAYSVISLMLQ